MIPKWNKLSYIFCGHTAFSARRNFLQYFHLPLPPAHNIIIQNSFILYAGWTVAFVAGHPYFVLSYRTGESLVGSLWARQIAKPTVTLQVFDLYSMNGHSAAHITTLYMPNDIDLLDR